MKLSFCVICFSYMHISIKFYIDTITFYLQDFGLSLLPYLFFFFFFINAEVRLFSLWRPNRWTNDFETLHVCFLRYGEWVTFIPKQCADRELWVKRSNAKIMEEFNKTIDPNVALINNNKFIVFISFSWIYVYKQSWLLETCQINSGMKFNTIRHWILIYDNI